MARPLTGMGEADPPRESLELRLSCMVTGQFAFVWRLLRRMGVPASDADDAAQQVFLVAAQRIRDIAVGSERSFLCSTALHVGSRFRRSHARKREDLGGDLDAHVDQAPSQEEQLDRQRARSALDQILAEMPLELRAVFVLYEIEQLTSVEIAELISVPVGTVASRLRRARDDFRARVSRAEARRNFGGQHHV